MNVRKALWMAGLGTVFALPLAAAAQTAAEPPPATQAPGVILDAPPAEGGSSTEDVAPSIGVKGFFNRADPAGQQRFWFDSEALLMWTKSMNVPPLVTTGPVIGLPAGVIPGTLGVAGTTSLVDKQIGFGPSAGGRFTFGGWLLPNAPLGVEVSYMFVGQATGSRHLAGDGSPASQALSLPFFDAANNVESAAPIALPVPGGFGGSVDIRTTTRLQGWEVTGGTDFGNFGKVHVIGIGGYRYLGIHEGLSVTTARTNTDPTVNGIFQTADNFSTTNAFNGGQLGLRGECCFGTLSLNATGKVALGDIRQQSSISGVTVTNFYNGFGAPQSFNSGYLATGTNSGTQSRDRIAVVPEVQLTTAWQPVCWLRLSVGYQGLYVSSVARPTDQLDRAINTSQSPAFLTGASQTLVGPARPALLPVAHSDFWMQGVTAGMEFKF